MADLIKKIKIKKQDGTFTDYIPIGAEAQNISTSDGESVQLKLNKKPYYYNSVADMKADLKLKTGDMAITLGYYNMEIGGGAIYKIRQKTNSDIIDNMIFIPINNNTLIAELVISDYMSPEQLGAYGDNTHDDYNVLIKIIEYSLLYNFHIIGTKEYLISNTLTILSDINLKLNKINYTGEDTALLINGRHNNIDINWIATNGNALRLTPTETITTSENNIEIKVIKAKKNAIELIARDWGILDTIIKFDTISTESSYYGIYCYAEHNTESSHPAYIGEVSFYGGRVSGGIYGVYAKSIGDDASVQCEITNLKLYNISVEGSANGIYLDNVNGAIINYPRYIELNLYAATTKILRLVNNTRNCVFNGNTPISLAHIKFDELTNSIESSNILNVPIQRRDTNLIGGQTVKCNTNGLFYEPYYKYYAITISNGIDLRSTTMAAILPTHIQSTANINIEIYFDKNYNALGFQECYFEKVNNAGSVTFKNARGETLYTIQDGTSGQYHFWFDQNCNSMVVKH